MAPIRKVYACSDCGEEWRSDDETCPLCGAEVVRVDPQLVAIIDLLEALTDRGDEVDSIRARRFVSLSEDPDEKRAGSDENGAQSDG